jgi:peptidoglycan/LPS O-acetylase OafA/YrhL
VIADCSVPTVNTSQADNPSLTAVRGIAALWVFVYHAWVISGPQLLLVSFSTIDVDLTPLASVGWAGVDVFYVLSGFLLWGVFDAWALRRSEHVLLMRFAKRRALRILPPYYAQLVLVTVLALATGLVARPTAIDLVAHATLTHSWWREYFLSMNGVWWTLSIEAQFYFVLPLLALLVRTTGWKWTIVIGLFITVGWRLIAYTVTQHDNIPVRVWLIEQLPGRIDQFLFGMFARYATRADHEPLVSIRQYLRAHVWSHRFALAFGPLIAVALAYKLHVNEFFISYWNGDPWLFGWHTDFAIGIAVTLYALAIGNPRMPPQLDPNRSRLRDLIFAGLVGFGTISYSFYLWHEMLLRWITPLIMSYLSGGATPMAFPWTLAVGFSVCLIVSIAWYRLFEHPFLKARAQLRRDA